MKKIDKKMLLFGILLCLLPMLIGFYYYDLLPDKIAIHFNMQGNPDNFVSKTWGIVGLPLVMGAVFLVLSIALDIQETGKKGASLVKMIIPIMSILLQGALIYYALDNNFDVGKLTLFTVGIIFMVLGNYLPKKEYWGKYNFNLCGLEKGLNEQKFIRIYSRFMVASGVLIFLSAFFDNRLGVSIVIIFAILSAILPFYLAKKYRIKD